MKKTVFSCLVLSTLLSLTACTSLQPSFKPVSTVSAQQQEIKSYFDQIQTHGVIVVLKKDGIHSYGNDLSRANSEYVPASTFKIVNALIGLEHNKVSVDEVFKWDGKKRSFESWEKDMNMVEAMKLSAVPVYQSLAKRIGIDLMAQELKRINFGNAQVGDQVDNFWLVGPLKITPVQEIKFVDQLARQQLPFKTQVQQSVKDMLLVQEINGNKIYAKSGWGMDVDPQVGWLTGWVERTHGDIVPFSLNMEMKPKMSGAIRNDILLKSLTTLGII